MILLSSLGHDRIYACSEETWNFVWNEKKMIRFFCDWKMRKCCPEWAYKWNKNKIDSPLYLLMNINISVNLHSAVFNIYHFKNNFKTLYILFTFIHCDTNDFRSGVTKINRAQCVAFIQIHHTSNIHQFILK